ncbi:hypothetical protein [Sphingomonas sp. ID0503]|uniref:hypothetical protein n=1 Tax=Sphingomonas sp. ID0503 TaxID=3399691 RepID=UPI003AFA97F5
MTRFLAFLALLAITAPAVAASPGDRLTQAALSVPDKKAAEAIVESSLAEIDAVLRADPKNWDMRLQRGIGLGYRAKLTRSIGDAKAARDIFTQLVRERPNDPQGLIALASWHIETVADVGALIGSAVLGAKREAGLGFLTRAVKASGDQALVTGFAALLHARALPKDVAATRALVEAAMKDQVNIPLDREMQKRAARLLPALRANDGKAAATLAATLLPLGAVK